ncbi:CapA family protein [uncultured Desulfovibrio sp.]|uniref:CapA family protein n=1 Tax=uncultured Desulfovibrio sp. TaxID=167968 RepID=UPI002631EE89|nr:CapA family protein [uncultured Desulfovibrio sp.]
MPSCRRSSLLLVILLFLCPHPTYGRALEILAAGDVILGGGMRDVPPPSSLIAPEARRRIEQADVFLWNCESAGPSSVSKDNLYVFHADATFFPEMRFANGAACTANNHVFDGYEEGARTLLQLLEQSGIPQNGLHPRGRYAPLPLAPASPVPVYLLTGSPMSQRGSGPQIVTLNYPLLRQWIHALRQAVPESLIIVYSHDGMETQLAPTPRQRQWATIFAAAGADVLLFAHSHLYGGVEILQDSPRRTLVAWSLGNFLFGGNRKWKNHRDVRLLRIRINPDDGSKDAVWLLGHTQNWRFSFYPARGVQQGFPDRHPGGGHDARERGMATGAGHPSLSR